MNAGCLSPRQFRSLLDGSATESQRAAAEQHLDTCGHCRRQLEDLAGAPDDLRQLRSTTSVDACESIPLTRVIQELTHETVVSTAPLARGTDPGGVIARLSPSPVAGSLGRLAEFEIVDVIASGGMGVVLKAVDQKLNRVVALKVLAPVLAADPVGRDRFVREARSVAAIQHDHVVGIYSVGEANGLPFLAMELVRGETLADRLAREGALQIEEVIRIAQQVASALGAAHERGIIHRDIKPGNVLIESASGNIKVTDFGLARAIDDIAVTRPGLIVGTPEYLSPEQASGQALDARSDWFSFGCLLYALCVGDSPFRASTTLATLRRVAEHRPAAACQINHSIPPWFSKVIDRLLSKDPAQRFESSAAVLAALGGQADAGEGASRWLHPRRRGLAIAAVAVALSIGTVWWALNSHMPLRGFQARTPDGSPLGKFGDLQEALAAVPANGILELSWNDERELKPVQFGSKPLRIRAANNFHPIWVYRDSSEPALTSASRLSLEGIEFRFVPNATGPLEKRTPRPAAPLGVRLPQDAPAERVCFVLSSDVLEITGCLFRRTDAFEQRDDGFAIINLENARQCLISDSALLLGAGKALVCRGGKPTITLSNCIVFASQAIWMDPNQDSQPKVDLAKSSFKGGTVLHFPPTHPHHLTVVSSFNLFNTTSIIVDQRPGALEFLPTGWLNWRQGADLYCLARPLGRERAFIRFDNNPGRSPARLRGWLHFTQQSGQGSFEADAQFTKARQPGTRSGVEPPSFDDFRVDFVRPVMDGDPPPPPEISTQFGADVKGLEARWVQLRPSRLR